MNRRNFLSLLGLGVAGVALDQAIPFGRVWSFPKEIVVAPRLLNEFCTVEYITREWLETLERNLCVKDALGHAWVRGEEWKVGDKIKIRLPQRWHVRDPIPAARPVSRPSTS